MVLTGSSFINTNGFNATLTGGLSGTGGLTKSGPGSLLLPNANTYQGGTTIAQGSVIANDSNALGTGQIVLLSGGKLEVGDVSGPVDEVVIANSIVIGVGGGTITNYGSFSKATFSGPISLNNTLTVTAGSNDPAFVKVTGGITGTGNVTLNSVNSALVVVETGAVNNIGTITNNGNSPIPTVISSAIGTNVTGVIQNSATNALVLTGTSTYTGPTSITSGTLRVNGSIVSNVTVSGPGTLAGSGSVGTISLSPLGQIAPGNSIGTLSAISLTWNGTATLVFDLGALASDKLSLSGALTKGTAGAFAFTFLDAGWQAGQTYDLVEFGSTTFLATDFSYTNSDISGNFGFSGNKLQFTATAVPEPSTVALVAAGLLMMFVLRRRAGRTTRPL
jgi:autotransporter-associated beta strand protein